MRQRLAGRPSRGTRAGRAACTVRSGPQTRYSEQLFLKHLPPLPSNLGLPPLSPGQASESSQRSASDPGPTRFKVAFWAYSGVDAIFQPASGLRHAHDTSISWGTKIVKTDYKRTLLTFARSQSNIKPKNAIGKHTIATRATHSLSSTKATASYTKNQQDSAQSWTRSDHFSIGVYCCA